MNKNYFSFAEKMDVTTLFDNLVFLINYHNLEFNVTNREPFVLVDVLFRGIADKKDRLMFRLTNGAVSVVFLVEVEQIITINKKQVVDSFFIEYYLVGSSDGMSKTKSSGMSKFLIDHVLKLINEKYPSETKSSDFKFLN